MSDVYTTPLTLLGLLTATSVPVKLDSYHGCNLGCYYCFSAASKANHESKGLADGRRFDNLKPGCPEGIRRLLLKVHKGTPTKAPAILWLREYPVFQWGVLSDPLTTAEKHFRVTQKVLENLVEDRWSGGFTFTTKRPTVLRQVEYLKPLLHFRKRCVVLVSCSALDERIAAVEPLAPHPRERLEAVQDLVGHGFRVMIRIEPFYPHLMKETISSVKEYAKAGVSGIVVGSIYLKEKQEASVKALYERLEKGLQFPLRKELMGKIGFIQDGGYTYPFDQTIRNHHLLRKVAHDSGIEYYPADSPSRMMGDLACPFGTSPVLDPDEATCSISELAYHNPDDFGPHLIDFSQTRLQSDGLRLWHSSSAHRAELASKGISTIGDVIRYWYNDPRWVAGLVPYATPLDRDEDGNQHYKLDPRWVDFCVKGRLH